MKITIIAASKIKQNSFLFKSLESYLKRFTNLKLDIIEFDEKNLNTLEINQKIFSSIKKDTYKIMLDEKGDMLSSIKFKDLLIESYPIYNSITFLIAGSDGFLPEFKNKANKLLSLSSMTFPHQMARLILIEQLYRVQSLINNHPYHR